MSDGNGRVHADTTGMSEGTDGDEERAGELDVEDAPLVETVAEEG
jgi:hypothetical protein